MDTQERDFAPLLSWTSSSLLSCIVLVLLYHDPILSALFLFKVHSSVSFWELLFQIAISDIVLRLTALLLKVSIILFIDRFSSSTSNSRRVLIVKISLN